MGARFQQDRASGGVFVRVDATHHVFVPAKVAPFAPPRLPRLHLPQRPAVEAHRIIDAHLQVEDVTGGVAVVAP